MKGILLLLTVLAFAVPGQAFAQSSELRSRLTAPCETNVSPLSLTGDNGTAAKPADFDFGFKTRTDGMMEVSLTSKKTGGGFTFVGGDHITGPKPKLFAYFEELIAEKKPSSVFIEVADTSYIAKLPGSKDEVIRTRGEPSYIGYIARANAIPVLPLEPKPEQLFGMLAGTYEADEVALANILREVQIMRDRRGLFGEELERVASRAIKNQAELARNTPVKITNILSLTLRVEALWPGLDWRKVPAEWFNPLLESESTGSLYINELFNQEMVLRDNHALELMLSQVKAGDQVIALAGRTHAENHLVALNCMLKNL